VGVQFEIDGAALGIEDRSPPYGVDWNTRSTSNGEHTIAAIARDLAGNYGADSISVTVDNVVPPPPVDHLAAAYAFDESGGNTTTDSSGNGNTATLHGATFSAGVNGNALSFDGTNDYAEAPNSASLDIGGTGITIALWVRINSTSSGVDYVIVGKPWYAMAMTSPFYQYGVEYSNSSNKTLDFFFGDPAANLHGPYRMHPAPGVWTHAAFTYDGSAVRGYLDGVERLYVSDASSLVPRGNSLRFGVDGVYQQFFNGAIDDLRIYARALNPQEIVSVMQTPVGGPVTAVAGEPARPFTLSAAAPNPFRATMRVSFTLTSAAEADLRAFDASGRLVAALAHARLAEGPHSIAWDGADAAGRPAPSGRYFLRLRVGSDEETRPVVLVR
jgi:hypothetical protein